MVHFPRAARMASMAQAASRGAREPGTMLRIGALLEHWADHRPEGLAVVCGAERLDWRTLHQRVHRCANALQSLGLRQGDRLAVMLPNGLPLLELYRAAATLGLGLVPLLYIRWHRSCSSTSATGSRRAGAAASSAS